MYKMPRNGHTTVAQTSDIFSHLTFLKNDIRKLSYETSPSSSNSTSPTTTVPVTTSADKTDNNETLNFLPDAQDMKNEENRLKTFGKWPLTFLKPEVLAKNGFYYLGRGDEVRCAFCKVEIMRWLEGDDPAKDHQRWAPQCPFVRTNGGVGDVSHDASATTGRDECGAKSFPSPNAMQLPRPVHPHYASEAVRLRTFKDWPRSMPQKPEELAEAGFFYTGQGDKTKCFYCDGGLKDWENEDVPWEQHARWFDRCPYVQLVKGRDYVQKVISEACVVPATKEEKPVQNNSKAVSVDEEPSIEDTKLCKICYAEERNVCFVPCGHVVACAKCALSTDKCPLCRRTFTNAVRLYFS